VYAIRKLRCTYLDTVLLSVSADLGILASLTTVVNRRLQPEQRVRPEVENGLLEDKTKRALTI
jgi:hypothetical protein